MGMQKLVVSCSATTLAKLRSFLDDENTASPPVDFDETIIGSYLPQTDIYSHDTIILRGDFGNLSRVLCGLYIHADYRLVTIHLISKTFDYKDLTHVMKMNGFVTLLEFQTTIHQYFTSRISLVTHQYSWFIPSTGTVGN